MSVAARSLLVLDIYIQREDKKIKGGSSSSSSSSGSSSSSVKGLLCDLHQETEEQEKGEGKLGREKKEN